MISEIKQQGPSPWSRHHRGPVTAGHERSDGTKRHREPVIVGHERSDGTKHHREPGAARVERRLVFSCFLTLSLLLSCKTIAPTPQSLIDSLKAKPGTYLSGQPLALINPQYLNREDFVYDAKISNDGSAAAVSRLGMKSYYLSSFALKNPLEKGIDVAVNGYEFDVEAIEFLPDGTGIVTASRDGALRVFSNSTGKNIASWLGEEPLSSVAVSADGKWIAAGSVRGLITILAWPTLSFVTESRPHTDEVRSLVFAADGRLFSGSWDKSIVVHSILPGSDVDLSARLHTELKNGLKSVRAVIDDKVSAVAVADARLPVLVVKGALAQSIGINAGSLTETMNLPAPAGMQVAKVAHGKSVSFKGLTLTDIDVAICDVCVPNDVQAALGQQVLDRVEIANDDSTKELLFTVKPGVKGVKSTAQFTLSQLTHVTFEASVNDLSISADGSVLGVAFSQDKGQRTRDVYEREKRKEVEPVRDWDCGARVDSKSLEILEKFHGHHGVVATAGISPDGKHLVTGGWDKLLIVQGAPEMKPTEFGWALRRARFSKDGRSLIVAAWTPQNPLNDHQSDPSAVIYEVVYGGDTKVIEPR